MGYTCNYTLVITESLCEHIQYEMGRGREEGREGGTKVRKEGGREGER